MSATGSSGEPTSNVGAGPKSGAFRFGGAPFGSTFEKSVAAATSIATNTARKIFGSPFKPSARSCHFQTTAHPRANAATTAQHHTASATNLVRIVIIFSMAGRLYHNFAGGPSETIKALLICNRNRDAVTRSD